MNRWLRRKRSRSNGKLGTKVFKLAKGMASQYARRRASIRTMSPMVVPIVATFTSPNPTAPPSCARAWTCRADRCSRTFERRSEKTARQAAFPRAGGRLRLSYACVRTARAVSLFARANLYAAAGPARRLSEDGGDHRPATGDFRAAQRLWG